MVRKRWIVNRKKGIKTLTKTGRVRKLGFRNTTDKNKPKGSKRVRGYVNNTDTGKKGIARKNYRKRRAFSLF